MKRSMFFAVTLAALLGGASLPASASPLLAFQTSGAPAATPSPSAPLTPERKSSLMERINQRVMRLAFVPGKDFRTWPEQVAKVQEQIDKATTSAEFANAVNAALNAYGVSHMSVITPEAATARTTGGQVGIGIMNEVVPEGIRVNAVLPGSPAAEAGMKAGDTIVLVNGVKPTSRDSLSGPTGTTFTLTLRGADGKTREVKVTRRFFSTREPQSLTWHPGDVAVLRIPTFDVGFNGDQIRQFVKEATPRAKLMVLDLRGNPGGVVFNMLQVSGYFIPNTVPIGTMVNRNMVDQFVRETGKSPDDLRGISTWSPNKLRPMPQATRYEGKLAVMIDGGTGSAAEMIAAALKETREARVFGQKSVGMVLASVITPLGEGWQMIVPIQDYVTVQGQRLEGTGVEPHVLITENRTADKDPVLASVLRWHTSGK